MTDFGRPFGTTTATTRRRLVVGALAAVLTLAGLAAWLAWSQYGDAKHVAVKEQRARAVVVASVFDTYFTGQISTLNAIAAAPLVVAGDQRGMAEYFRRVQPPDGGSFTGGLGWIDSHGVARASSNPAGPGFQVNVADRSFFRQVMASGKPFISEGLVSRTRQQRVVGDRQFRPGTVPG